MPASPRSRPNESSRYQDLPLTMSAVETINFTRGVPAIESYPDRRSGAVRGHCARRPAATPCCSTALPPACRALRNWLAEWQGVKPEQVLAGNGSLELIEFLCTALLKPGDVVFTEAPSYDRAITLFRRHGLTVVGVPLEADGPNIEALEKLLAQHTPKLFYVIPDFQNPSGATCSAEKRKRIAELAGQHDVLLLEDAPYRLLRYRGTQEPTLYSMAPQRTLHMTSFTKLIAPGVRLGFMMGDAAILAKIAKVAEDTYIAPGGFAHGVTLEWLKAGKLGAADREAQGAVRAAPRCVPGRARQVHSRCRGHAPRWRILPVADAAAGRFHHRPARRRREAQPEPGRWPGVLPAGRRRALPAPAVLRADAGADRRRQSADWPEACGTCAASSPSRNEPDGE